ncbi:hypothetical protein ACIOZM_14485 [Pseudomonas sp. NPDC087346]|uniref:hypothetical protein n=1 Tax=Pseudomonas sp. NPDC087346 TaxID=3364438 RepID=UPI003814ED28
MNTDIGSTIYICAGAVVLMSNQIPQTDRCDGLDALLYSQTVASHKEPDLSKFEAWTHAGKVAMRVAGAMFLENPQVSLPVPLPESFSLVELGRKVLRHWVPDTQLAALSDQPVTALASELLCRHVSDQGRCIRIMFGVISLDLIHTMAIIGFESDEVVVGDLLHHRFNPQKVQGNISVDSYRVQLEREDYDLSRATVIALLGARRSEQIIALS